MGLRLQRRGLRSETQGLHQETRFSAPQGPRPHVGPAQNRTRPSWSSPAAALPQALRLHPARPSPGRSGLTHPARLTRRPSLSDQAAAVPTAEARPPTAAASPRAHRLRRRADPRGLGAGPASQRRRVPPAPPPNGNCVPAPRPRPPRARHLLRATPQPIGHALHRLPSCPTCGVRGEGSPWARGRVDREARSKSHPPLLANKKMELTSWPLPQTAAASLDHASARSPRPSFPTSCNGS
jgi:hypothetical protein